MAAIATGVLAALWVGKANRPWPAWAVSALGCVGTACILAILVTEDLIWPVLGQATMLVLTGGTALLLLAFQWRWLGRWTARGEPAGFGRAGVSVTRSTSPTSSCCFLSCPCSTVLEATCALPGCGSSPRWAYPGAWAGWSTGRSPRLPTGGCVAACFLRTSLLLRNAATTATFQQLHRPTKSHTSLLVDQCKPNACP